MSLFKIDNALPVNKIGPTGIIAGFKPIDLGTEYVLPSGDCIDLELHPWSDGGCPCVTISGGS